MRINRIFVILTLILVLSACKQEWNELAINSPDFKLQLIFHLTDGKPVYRLNYKGNPFYLNLPWDLI